MILFLEFWLVAGLSVDIVIDKYPPFCSMLALAVLSYELGASRVVMASKQTFTSEFDSHWVPQSNGLVLHLRKSLSKLLLSYGLFPCLPTGCSLESHCDVVYLIALTISGGGVISTGFEGALSVMIIIIWNGHPSSNPGRDSLPSYRTNAFQRNLNPYVVTPRHPNMGKK